MWWLKEEIFERLNHLLKRNKSLQCANSCLVFLVSFVSALHVYFTSKYDDDDDDDIPTPTEHSLKENIVHVGHEVKQGVQKVGNTMKPVLQTVQAGVKTGVKTGVQSVQSGVKAGVQSVSNMWTAFKNRRTEQSSEKDLESVS